MSDPILIRLGDPTDLCSKLLAARAELAGLDDVFLNEEKLGDQWDFRVSKESVSLFANDTPIELSRAIFFPRFSPKPSWDRSADRETAYAAIRERRSAINHFLCRVPGPVVNRPYVGLENGSKPLQMIELVQAGFRVPPWIVTNSRLEAFRFDACMPKGCLFKSVSGMRSSVGRMTNLPGNDEILATPIVVQRFVSGYDVRCHVVDDICIATMMSGTKGIDYRDKGAEARFEAISVPRGLEQLMLGYARSKGIFLSGFDFKVDKAGCWHCLEMNPAPTFVTYELATGQKVTEAILDKALNRIG